MSEPFAAAPQDEAPKPNTNDLTTEKPAAAAYPPAADLSPTLPQGPRYAPTNSPYPPYGVPATPAAPNGEARPWPGTSLQPPYPASGYGQSPGYPGPGGYPVPSAMPPGYPAPYGAPPAQYLTPYAGNPDPNAPAYAFPPPIGSTGARLTTDTGAGRRNRVLWPTLTSIALIFVFLLGMGGSFLLLRATPTGPSVTIGSANGSSNQITSNATSLQGTVQAVAAAVQPAVVAITTTSGNRQVVGSGDILTQSGYIVTNDRLVSGASSVTVTLANQQTYQAQLVGEASQEDLAVIKIAATGLQTVSLADSSALKVGEFAIAIGNPLAQQSTTNFGIVSALNRTASEAPAGPAGTLIGLVQTSTELTKNNLGGALVDLQGQLIGIPTLGEINTDTGTNANGITYAISSNRIAYVTKQLIATGHLTNTGEGFLGIAGQDVTPALATQDNLSVQSGVLVADFANDAAGVSPAQQGGMQKGDVIIALGGNMINASSDLSGALLNDAPGTKVTMTVMRGTQQLSITVTLGERPTNLNG